MTLPAKLYSINVEKLVQPFDLLGQLTISSVLFPPKHWSSSGSKVWVETKLDAVLGSAETTKKCDITILGPHIVEPSSEICSLAMNIHSKQ